MQASRRILLLCLAGVLLTFGCSLFTGGSPPEAAEPPPATIEPLPEETVAEPPPEAGEPSPGEAEPPPQALPSLVPPESTQPPALPEQRRLTVEYPPVIRAGDSDIIRLTLEVDEGGNLTPTAEVGGNVVTGERVEIPNLYETHHVIAEARFDIAGLEVRPAELVSEALSPGNTITFRWSVRPTEVGIYRGTIWLYLRFVDKQSGEESRKTLSAQIVEIQGVNFLGFSGALARNIGVVGSVVGTIVGFPFFEDLVKWLFRRRRVK
jgi:hypothetical protein